MASGRPRGRPMIGLLFPRNTGCVGRVNVSGVGRAPALERQHLLDAVQRWHPHGYGCWAVARGDGLMRYIMLCAGESARDLCRPVSFTRPLIRLAPDVFLCRPAHDARATK
jgi:hypothetical protein